MIWGKLTYMVIMCFIMPIVSVVIPLYNKSSSIMAAVKSALAQDVGDGCDVIVVDDGSTDDSGERVRAFRHPRLTFLHQENMGVSAARNRGLMASEAKWIAFLDADDLWEPGHLASLLQSVRCRTVTAAFSNIVIEGADSNRLLLMPHIPAHEILDYFRFALAHGGYPNMTSATMVRREAAIAAGQFTVGVSMGEDVDMWCRLALAGPIAYTGAVTATYRDTAPAAETSPYKRKLPEFPIFAALLTDLMERGAVPPRLHESAARYAHFLVLEHARQLLDQGLHVQARHVLLRHGRPTLDPLRYARRMFRTFSVGRAAFALSGRRIKV